MYFKIGDVVIIHISGSSYYKGHEGAQGVIEKVNDSNPFPYLVMFLTGEVGVFRADELTVVD